MLRKLLIHNFGLHKDCTIRFSPKITTIVGKSYAGKSTIIRSLKWVCLNRPAGTSIIRWGASEAKVNLYADRYDIERNRGKGKNQYRFKKRKDKRYEKLEAFGRNCVPDKISAILNITENNFQGQHNLPFWFGNSGGDVARKLNTIVNLTVIDKTLSNVASMIRKSKSAVEVSKERLQDAIARKKELMFVNAMAKEWKSVQSAIKSYDTINTQVEDLEEAIQNCKEHKKNIKEIKLPSLKLLTTLYDELQQVEKKYNKLDVALCQIGGTMAAKNIATKEADRLEFTKNRCPLCGKK